MFPLWKQCPPYNSTKYCTHVAKCINQFQSKTAFLATEKVNKESYIRNIYSLRGLQSHWDLNYNLQPAVGANVTNQVFCTKKWVSCARSHPVSKSLNMKRQLGKPRYNGYQSLHLALYIHIFIFLCNIIWGLLPATVTFYQAQV